jgi:predicted NodU family carbamoyl transferase
MNPGLSKRSQKKTLGIHIGHDSGVSLVINGKIIADVAEEWFSRVKHYAGLPVRSIEYCLTTGKIASGDIDYIAIPSIQSSDDLGFLFNDVSIPDSSGVKFKNLIPTELKHGHILPSIKTLFSVKKLSLEKKQRSLLASIILCIPHRHITIKIGDVN